MRALAYSILGVLLVSLTACDNFTPRPKVATYSQEEQELILPYPCPDWSQSQVHNYRNQPHSDFGCSVNTNLAVQLENPEDLLHGHGDARPDIETTTKVIQDYRAGKIPAPLTATATTGSSQ